MLHDKTSMLRCVRSFSLPELCDLASASDVNNRMDDSGRHVLRLELYAVDKHCGKTFRVDT